MNTNANTYPFPIEENRKENRYVSNIKLTPYNKNSTKNAEGESTEYKSYNLDKDIIVYYRHKDNLPGSVDFVAYKEKGKRKGTFMMTITPGDDLKPISNGDAIPKMQFTKNTNSSLIIDCKHS